MLKLFTYGFELYIQLVEIDVEQTYKDFNTDFQKNNNVFNLKDSYKFLYTGWGTKNILKDA